MTEVQVSVTKKFEGKYVTGVGSYSNTGKERTYVATSVTSTCFMLGNKKRLETWFSGSVRQFRSSDPAILAIKKDTEQAALRAYNTAL